MKEPLGVGARMALASSGVYAIGPDRRRHQPNQTGTLASDLIDDGTSLTKRGHLPRAGAVSRPRNAGQSKVDGSVPLGIRSIPGEKSGHASTPKATAGTDDRRWLPIALSERKSRLQSRWPR